MPAEIREPLTIVFSLPGGVVYERRMDDLPDQALAGDLARALVAATHPHGPIRTRSVAAQYVQTMRRMVRELHVGGFVGGIGELTPAVIVQYWLTCDFHRERRIRAVLSACAAVGGVVHPGVQAHLRGRRINAVKPSRPNRPYSDNEWRQLARACTESMTTAYAAHRQAREAAERGSDPRLHGVTDDNLAWLVHRLGPVPDAAVAAALLDAASGLDPARLAGLRRALYPDGNTALAYNVAFAMRTGIVPDGIDRLSLADITRTGPTTVLLSYVKGRTGAEALNLPGDAVRVLDRWLDHSAALRPHAGGLAERLWTYAIADGRDSYRGRVFVLQRPGMQWRRGAWVRAAGVVGDDGEVLALHGGRLRATYQHRRDRKAWTGRTTIDPNHSAQVEGDHYLSSHTPAQLDAIEGVIEEAQSDLRRKAEPPTVTTGDDVAEFAASFPRLVHDARLDAEGIATLLGGAQDVYVAGCASPLNSPYAPAGTLCPARPWVCLLCPLATFTPRHLPNLLGLKEYFSRQAAQMTLDQFMAIFGPYAARLDEDILPRFPTEAIDEAARQPRHPLPLYVEEIPR
jgi:hypothetical protein